MKVSSFSLQNAYQLYGKLSQVLTKQKTTSKWEHPGIKIRSLKFILRQDAVTRNGAISNVCFKAQICKNRKLPGNHSIF